jgi:hypothetical protein
MYRKIARNFLLQPTRWGPVHLIPSPLDRAFTDRRLKVVAYSGYIKGRNYGGHWMYLEKTTKKHAYTVQRSFLEGLVTTYNHLTLRPLSY